MLRRLATALLAACASGQASAQSSGPPDTIASCVGRADCARCILFRPSAVSSKITVRPAEASCAKQLSERVAFAAAIDAQTHAYGRFDALSSSAAIETMYTDLGSGRGVGAPLGSTGVVLSSQMHQNYEAAKTSNMVARVNSIEAAMNTSTANLRKSFEDTRAQLPMSDAAVQAHLAQTAQAFAEATQAALSGVGSIVAAPKEVLPVRPSGAEPFLTHGVTRNVIAQRVEAEISEAHRRASGRDLADAMQRGPGGAAAQARAEAAKVRAAQAQGQISAQPAARMLSQLEAASRLSASPYPKGRTLADRVVADTVSERQVSQGRSDAREVSSVDADGNVTVVTQPGSSLAPENATAGVIATLSIRIDQATQRSSQALAIANAYQAADAVRRRDAALASRAMAANAEKALMQGHLGDAEVWAEAALLVADVATGWVPALSLGRSTYELISGRDLFSGEELSNLELAGRVLDVVTVGFGSKLSKGWEAVNRIAQKNDKYRRIFASAKKYADRMVKLGRNPVVHPEDLAHIADKHMPGGLNHIDEVFGTAVDRATVFNKDVDPLELAGDAMELIAEKSPSIQRVPSRSKGASDFYLWDRTGLKPEHIGYSASTAEAAKDVGIVVDRQEGRLVNIYPWNPKNPKPDLEGL